MILTKGLEGFSNQRVSDDGIKRCVVEKNGGGQHLCLYVDRGRGYFCISQILIDCLLGMREELID